MDTVDNTHGASLIAKFAKTTGRGFDKTRSDVIRMMSDSLNADIVDAFSVAHVGVAKLIEDMRQDIHGDENDCDRVFSALAIIVTIASVMQAQHTIHVHKQNVDEMLRGAPDIIRMKAALLAATPGLKERQNELPQLVEAMIALFMSNVVNSLNDA